MISSGTFDGLDVVLATYLLARVQVLAFLCQNWAARKHLVRHESRRGWRDVWLGQWEAVLDPGSQSEVSSCLRVTSGVTESRSSLLDLGTSRMDGADISKQTLLFMAARPEKNGQSIASRKLLPILTCYIHYAKHIPQTHRITDHGQS